MKKKMIITTLKLNYLKYKKISYSITIKPRLSCWVDSTCIRLWNGFSYPHSPLQDLQRSPKNNILKIHVYIPYLADTMRTNNMTILFNNFLRPSSKQRYIFKLYNHDQAYKCRNKKRQNILHLQMHGMTVATWKLR